MKQRSAIATVLLLCMFGPVLAQNSGTSEQAKLRFAATQHEIISILIDEGAYDRVLPEFRKILNLKLSDETLIVQEVSVISNKLVRAEAFSTAHQIVDEFLPMARDKDNRFALLMIKGKIFKQEGRLREAVEVYRQAQRLND